ncbi:TATA box-binding protein-associated factor RNA polymerase I subunit A [Pyxicephalus adspersus]|uniref:TATA box-binding protein-associated factor RNA polymerase I subunit A n=1 Tax=Pyxicephalus adspersus TaxID=30357 RepID=A0AAV3AJL6_PYXAD|nr:TPA: hypothetical protein GDO54_011446 [Pyxicephalus adspersus]
MDMETDRDHSDETNEVPDEDEEFGLYLPMRLTSNKDVSTRNIGFTKSTQTCFQIIHEALYRNQWQRAASFFTTYLQTLESQSTKDLRRAPEILWQLGSEILLNHPKSMPEDINVFSETIKNVGVKYYIPISLEQVYFLLCNGQSAEAYRMLTTIESWRFGMISISQHELLKLVQAYRGIIDCWSWLDKKSSLDHTEMDFASQASLNRDMSAFFRQASITFKEILKHPGVWDPFILNYVKLLESSGDKAKAEKVLVKYAYNKKNPPNPNAHVYLYEFRKRRGDSDEELIKVLKALRMLVPSHKLMLEYISLLTKSESDEDHQLALQVLFDLLDFSGWKDNVEAWNCLVKKLKKTLQSGQSSWISEVWNSRSNWWPSYHFTQFQMAKNWRKSVKLAIKKASVAALLLGQDCRYFTSVYDLGDEKQKKALDRVVKLLKSLQ